MQVPEQTPAPKMTDADATDMDWFLLELLTEWLEEDVKNNSK